MKFLRTLLLPVLLFTLSITAIQGQSHAREFDYLVDGRASSIDNELRDMGYRLIKTDKTGSDAYQYWWNEAMNKCVTIRVNDGRVRSVVNTPDADCNRSGSNSYARSDNYNRYNRNNSSYNSVSVAYDRGYDDGVRNRKFNNSYYQNYDQKDAYADGYEEGENHRRDGSHWSGNSGNNNEDYRDLEGWGAKRAYGELERRGFEERRHHQQGGTTYRTWYNSRTGQCIKTVSKNERIAETMISTHCDE